MAICARANPDFTQLCPCAVSEAQAAGFQEPVLSALLGHDYTSATAQQVQEFGFIFVQCTQAAVAGNLPPIAMPEAEAFQSHDHAAPTATPPAPVTVQDQQPQVAQEQAPVIDLDPQPNAAPVITLDPAPASPAVNQAEVLAQTAPVIDLDPGRDDAGDAAPVITLDPAPQTGPVIDLDPAPGGSATETAATAAAPQASGQRSYRFEFAQNAPKQIGTWVPFVSLKTTHPWATWGPAIAAGGAVFDADGAFLIAGCNAYNTPILTVGPVSGTHMFSTGKLVVRGAGGILLDLFATPARIEGDLLQFSLRGDVLSALRRGSNVVIEATAWGGNGPDVRFDFGLKGSSKALETSGWRGCRGERVRAGMGEELVNGRWLTRYEKLPDGSSGPVARFEHFGGFERPMLRCDKRLRIDRLELWYVVPGSAPEYEAAPNYALRVDGNAPHEVHFIRDNEFVDTGVTRAPLPAGLIEELATGRALSVTPMLGEPGFGTSRAFELREIGAQLDGLVCPDTLPRPAVARTDLTATDYAWSSEDLSDFLFPGNAEADPIPMASFAVSAGVGADLPGMSLECTGVPFFWENYGANSPSFDVRMVVDGDEGRLVTVDYLNYRSIFNPGEVPADLGTRILNGTTLRLTSAANPQVDVLYPLQGARDALRAAGCPF
ncbi:MAG: hypothetical protein AAFQ19_06050 [Pseudomonadota bacterium]